MRKEGIVVEGGQWLEYQLHYKPGDVKRPPTFLWPGHLPRYIYRICSLCNFSFSFPFYEQVGLDALVLRFQEGGVDEEHCPAPPPGLASSPLLARLQSLPRPHFTSKVHSNDLLRLSIHVPLPHPNPYLHVIMDSFVKDIAFF